MREAFRGFRRWLGRVGRETLCLLGKAINDVGLDLGKSTLGYVSLFSVVSLHFAVFQISELSYDHCTYVGGGE